MLLVLVHWIGKRSLRRLTEQFAETAAKCMTNDALRSALDDVARELGFSFFALLHHASLRSLEERYIRIENYPDGWRNELVSHGLWRDDPVHRASRRVGWAFAWRDLERFCHVGPSQLRILERGRQFGLGDGLTVPMNVPGEPAGSCSFAVRRGAELPAERLHCAELIGSRAFAAARRIAGPQAPAAPPRLSRREIECLRLVAAGKTDDEIGTILGISRETARQYVKRARSAYDVVSRTQLAVLGLRDGHIDFDEAIDPRLDRHRGKTS